ncbi:MaoC/PaaZ C-terminal domain-containing protein [Janibacter sp. G368]|uniref:MaoC/PaaZ C-terminal domain-containing protein n=1 Tax=Janibacter sp. G368 TaxID=3420441 RepID=UPI003D00D8DB
MTQHPPGLYADDVHPGEVTSFGHHAVTEVEIIDFASQWDPQFFHVDPERAATEGAFGGLIASGIQTLGIYQRLSIDARAEHWHVIAGAGIEALRFHRPVRPGDVLTGSHCVTDVALDPDRRRGLLTFAGELTREDGASVLTLTMSAFLHMRPA